MTYVFDHIFKTAGTTFHTSYLSAAFDPTERFVVRGFVKENIADLNSLINLPIEQKNKLKIIAGHNAHCLRPYFPNSKFITLVRNPIDRAISAYLHAKYHEDAWDSIGRYLHEDRVSISEFIKSDLFSTKVAHFFSLHNGQAKTLIGSDISPIDSADLDGIREKLRSRFVLVGCTGQFELFLFLLHRTEGFPLVLFNNRLIRKERKNFEVSPADLDTIRQFNATDIVVHKLAKEDFDRRVADMWNNEIQDIYLQYMEALKQFRTETGGDVNRTQVFKY